MSMNRFLFSSIFFFLSTGNFFAQSFTQIASGIGKMNYTEVNDTYGVAIYGGVQNFVSTNQGLTWTTINNAVGSNIDGMEMKGAAVINSSTFCLIGYKNLSYQIVRTTDGGNSWTVVLLTGALAQDFKAITSHGNTVIVTAKNGIYQSLDGGATWNFVSLSNGNQVSPFVEYNNSSSTWFVGHYNADMLISSDQGSTWTTQNYNLNSTEIVDASFSNNNLLLIQKTLTGNRFLRVDSLNNLVDSIEIEQGQLYGVNPCVKAGYLANGDILTSSIFLFYNIDTTTGNLYHLSNPPLNLSNHVDLDLGSSYGLSIKYTNSGSQWTAYYINPTVSAPKYIYANPKVYSFNSICAGDNIQAIPYSNYADSLKWYINNTFITSNSFLNYPTSAAVYTTYNIKLIQYYNGISNTITVQKTFSAPQAPHPYTYQVNSIACYGQPLHVFINPNNGTVSNTVIELKYGNITVAGPQTMTANNINFYTTPITTSDTLKIITYNNGACNNTSATVAIPITVGADLLNFNFLDHDSSICIGENLPISFTNTNPSYSYVFSNNYPIPNYSWTQTTNGSTDTLQLTAIGLPWLVNSISSGVSYEPIINMYLQAQVTNPITGCVSSKNLDTIEVYRPKAYFNFHSRSFLKNDTVHLSNAFVTENRLWSSTNMPLNYIYNPTDTIPLILPDTSGFFNITLKNEPFPGCVDSTLNYVHIAEPAVEMDTSCYAFETNKLSYLNKFKLDQFGNRYELSHDNYGANTNKPLYRFRKYDTFGNLVWEKNATGFAYQMIGVVIEDFEFDAQGNPVCAAWISGDDDYQDSYFDFIPYGQSNNDWSFAFKIDKNTGNIIWRTRLNELANESFIYGLRTTDILIDGDNIHISLHGPSSGKIHFITLDNEGDSLSTGVFNIGWSTPQFIEKSYYIPSSYQPASYSFFSPQMTVLSTGEIVAVGYYSYAYFPNHPQLTINNDEKGIFIMKYFPGQGVYDVDNIAKIGYSSASGYPLRNKRVYVFTDQNDNITILAEFQKSVYSLTILDTVIPQHFGTFVLNFDTAYNRNWITMGTFAPIVDFMQVKSTGEYIGIVHSKDNVSFGQGNSHMMCGMDIPTTIQYTNIPINTFTYQFLDEGPVQPFFVRFDSAGIPVEMTKISGGNIVPNFNFPALRMASSPCGDFVMQGFNHVSNAPAIYSLNGQNLIVDSSKVFYFKSGCISSDCSYANAPDTINNCSVSPNFDVQFCDYYNLDSVVFDIYLNDTLLISNQIANVQLGEFQVNLSASGTYLLAISSPNVDTLIINNTISPNVAFSFLDSICFGDTLTINSIGSNSAINWLNSTYWGQNLSINQSVYTTGINLIDVEIVHGGCILNDTLSVFVENNFVSPNFTFQNPICYGQNVTINGSISSYSYSWLSGSQTGSNLLLDSTEYSIGTNTIDVSMLLGQCEYFDTLILTVNNCLGLYELSFLTSQISPNPNNGRFEVEFNQFANEISAELTDISGKLVYENKYSFCDKIECITDLEPGTYYLKISLDRQSFMRKLVVL